MKKYTIDEISTMLEEIQLLSEVDIDGDSMTHIVEHGKILSNKLAVTSKLLADAKYNLREFQNTEIMKMLKDQTSQLMYADAQRKYLESVCRDILYVVDWAERLNAACTHQLDFMRSLLSKEKERMALERQNNFRNT